MVVFAEITKPKVFLKMTLSCVYISRTFFELEANNSYKRYESSIGAAGVRCPLCLGHGISKLVRFYFSWPIFIVD